jgi:hypothetical protein
MRAASNRYFLRPLRLSVSPMSDPTVQRVVTTVHGTWARQATWVQPNSLMGRALIRQFGGGVHIEPFRWSGGNNPAARDHAKVELRAHLRRMRDKYPHAEQFVIAHSHAGNIVFYALRDEELGKAITGVICLATPFLVARPRVLAGKDITTHVVGGVGSLIVLLALLLRWALSGVEPTWLKELAMFGLFLFGMSLIATLLKEWLAFGARLDRAMKLPPVSRDRVLIVRAPGDEASAALLFTQFVSQVTVRLYVLLHQRHRRLEGMLERWSAHRLSVVGGLVAGLIVYGAAIALAVRLEFATAATLALVTLLSWACVAVPIALLVGWIDVAAFPLQIVTGVVLFAAIVVLSATLLPFGRQVALGNIVLDVTAETTPPGTWLVHQIGAALVGSVPDDAQPLQHSVVYEDPRSLSLICDWIGHCAPAARSAGAGV